MSGALIPLAGQPFDPYAGYRALQGLQVGAEQLQQARLGNELAHLNVDRTTAMLNAMAPGNVTPGAGAASNTPAALPPIVAPSSASAGMPGGAVGAAFPPSVSPYGARMSSFGVPLPGPVMGAVIGSSNPMQALHQAIQDRRQVLYQLASSARNEDEWRQHMVAAYQRGYLDTPAFQQAIAGGFANRDAIINSLATPEAHLAALTSLARDGLQLGATGALVPAAAAISAAGQKAGAVKNAQVPGEIAVEQAKPQTLQPGGQLYMPPAGGPRPAPLGAPAAGAPTPVAAPPSMPRTSAAAAPPLGGLPAGGAAPVAPVVAAGGPIANLPLPVVAPAAPSAVPAVIPGSPNDWHWYLTHQAPGPGVVPPSALPAAPAVPPAAPAAAGVTAPSPAPAAAPSTGSQAPSLSVFTGRQPPPSLTPSVTRLPNGGTVVDSGITPNIEEEAKARAGYAQQQRGKLDDEATQAAQMNTILAQMRAESQGFMMGKFADYAQPLKTWLDAAGQAVGFKPDQSVGDWQAFNKNATELVRQAVRATSARAAVQEFSMIQNALPSDTMSPQAFRQIAPQYEGVNDWTMAKQQAAANWRGDMSDFNAQWNAKVSPMAFVLRRLNPEEAAQLHTKLVQTDDGRALWGKLYGQVQTLTAAGMMEP